MLKRQECYLEKMTWTEKFFLLLMPQLGKPAALSYPTPPPRDRPSDQQRK